MSEAHRKPGRPPLGSEKKSVPITVRMQAQRADELYRLANAARMSVPALIRRTLARRDQ